MSLPPPPPRRPRAPDSVPAPPPPNARARTERRTQQRRSRWRGVLLGIGAIAGIVIAAGVVLLVTSGGGSDSEPEFTASTAVDLTAGETKIERTTAAFDAPPPIAAEVQEQVLGVLGRYVDEGVVGALRNGAAKDAALAEVFDAAAVARLAGADRTVVLDEGLPKAVGKVTVSTPAVMMTALAAPDGSLLFVSANVEFTITAQAAKGTVHIDRIGSFVLAPDPTTGWKITGWTLHIERSGPGVTPPTTVPTPSTTAVP